VALTRPRYTPELGSLELAGTCVSFRTKSERLYVWLRGIDRWVAYANSAVEG